MANRATGDVLGTIDEVDAKDAAQRGWLGELWKGERLGCVLRNVWPAAEVERFVAALSSPDAPIAPGRQEHYGGLEFGRALVVSQPQSDEYFAAATDLRRACEDLRFPFERVCAAVLTQLDGARSARSPRDTRGRQYGFATVRVIPPGGQIDVHCEGETVDFTAMADLARQLEGRAQLSFYTLLAAPERGGELRVYPLRFNEGDGARLARLSRRGAEVESLCEKYGWVTPRVGVGDLLIFDSGRHYHRVTAVEGTRARWTMGGFLGRASEDSAILYWG
jgi:hypothetical protein